METCDSAFGACPNYAEFVGKNKNRNIFCCGDHKAIIERIFPGIELREYSPGLMKGKKEDPNSGDSVWNAAHLNGSQVVDYFLAEQFVKEKLVMDFVTTRSKQIINGWASHFRKVNVPWMLEKRLDGKLVLWKKQEAVAL